MQDLSPKGRGGEGPASGRSVRINLQPQHHNSFSKSAMSNLLIPPSTRRHSTNSEQINEQPKNIEAPQILVIEELKAGTDTFTQPKSSIA